MSNTKEIESLINQIKRSLNYAEKGKIEVSVNTATEILDVLITYISDNKKKTKIGINDKATDKQLAFIRDMEEFVNESFTEKLRKKHLNI